MSLSLNGTNGIVLPTAAAPAFSAYLSSNQAISSSVFTKVQYNTKEFDTNSNYDNATNYRFTPTVAGYYQVNTTIGLTSSTAVILLSIYKNGSEFKRSGQAYTSSINCEVSALIYMNGSSDYIEGYCYCGNSATIVGSQSNTFFQACMVRSA